MVQVGGGYAQVVQCCVEAQLAVEYTKYTFYRADATSSEATQVRVTSMTYPAASFARRTNHSRHGTAYSLAVIDQAVSSKLDKTGFKPLPGGSMANPQLLTGR